MPKKCKGCGRLDTTPLCLNSKGEPYLACCPDNNYVDITAVEWLESKLPKIFKDLTINKELIEQAKKMEKEQVELRYKGGTPMRKYNSPKLQAIEMGISDEEIDNEAERYEKVDGVNSFKEAIKWYREQLRKN